MNMSLLIFQCLLVSSLIVLTTILLVRLITWWKKYSIWINQIVTRKQEVSSSLDLEFKISDPIPEFQLKSVKNNRYSNSNELNIHNKLLIFFDKDCIHCNNNFEHFLALREEHNKKIDFIIIFREESFAKALEISELYENELDIYVVGDETFKKFKLRFLPAFVKLNKRSLIELSTPVPLEIIRSI
jgi:hypothetical protein